jgi:ADP-heptose:LPS heptosyltransferase
MAAGANFVTLIAKETHVSPTQQGSSSLAQQMLNINLLDRAQALAEQALAENEGSADLHSLIANVFDRRGEWQSSLIHLRRAHELMPDAPQLRLNLAMALLRLGEYGEGLPLYEARLDKATWSGFATLESRAALRHKLLRPGEPIKDRHLLLLAEQGLGDSIMCARYIPSLAKLGARIVVASNPTLRPFFARIPGIETLLSPPQEQPFAQINLSALSFDGWLPLLSLPYWLGTNLSNVPADGPYWSADATRVAEWRTRLSAWGRPGTVKVGLVYQANPDGAGFSSKSMQVTDLAPLFALEKIEIVNLQYGTAKRALAAVSDVLDPLPTPVPLDQFGAVLAATDLLITVDTMAAHLAGALGHAAWVAIPHSPHWIWGLTNDSTVWYPSLRLFRQQKNRDWSSTMGAIVGALSERFGAAPRREVNLSDRVALVSDRSSERSKRAPGARSGSLSDIATFERREAERLDLASAQLRRGECEQGFANYEARQNIPLWSEQALPLRESLVAINERRLRPGDPIAGRHIAVFTEQGLGDTFFGARFLKLLAERGAIITLVCRTPMRPFFARLEFLDAILSPPEEAPHAKIDLRRLQFDAFSPLLSLPFVLGIGSKTILPSVPYLSADPIQVTAWRARYKRQGRSARRKIGVVWQANPSNHALPNRSLRAADLAPLVQLEGVDFVNLQNWPEGRELASAVPSVIDPLRTPLTLDEFAGALAATDLLVSVDTMAAHCAGALGHPSYLILGDAPAWYWGVDPEQSPWYPSTRLFRRGAGANFSDAIEAVAAAVRSGDKPALK